MSKYRLEIISTGRTVDTDDIAHGNLYVISTWTFRLLDPDSLRDWTECADIPLDAEISDKTYANRTEARLQARKLWEVNILSILLGHTVNLDDLLTWTITQSFVNVFSAVQITKCRMEAEAS